MMNAFSHPHPLLLVDESKSGDCAGCGESIVGVLSYGCGECPYFLHKKCAHLQLEIHHPLHLQHPLLLLDKSPYRSGRFGCNLNNLTPLQLGAQSSLKQMIPMNNDFSWESYSEGSPSADDDGTFANEGLWEQVNVTRDSTDYLWYMTDVNVSPNEAFLKNGQDPLLTIWSAGHALHVFINGQLLGSAYGGLKDPRLTFSQNVKLNAGVNKLSLLSIAVGLPNVGTHFEKWNAGVLGPVTLKGLNEGTKDLSGQKWSYKIGLKGEALSLHTVTGSSSVEWVEGSLLAKKQPLTWYKTTFSAPEGNDPLALDMASMGKGQIWINGQSIGRHWPGYIARGNCGTCDYTGYYNDKKCRTNCGEPSQRWYHVPRSWLNPSGNLVVVFEEWGGDPTGISFVKRTTSSVCADIFEKQPSMQKTPKAHLWCPPGQKMTQIKFASYGLPEGTCGSYREGSCHAHKSYDAFQKNCIGQQSCSVSVTPRVFGGDPCPRSAKKLSVEAICS